MEMHIYIAICEDELYQAQHIRELVSQWAGEEKDTTVSCYENADSFYAAWQAGAHFDILLLDIMMDDNTEDGMELAKRLRQSDN